MKKQFTEEQILQILGEAHAGLTVAEVCRKYGISQVTFYK
jgi:putative transposase